MADQITPNLGLTKPEVGASEDTWGNKLNDNLSILDSRILSRTGNFVDLAGVVLNQATGSLAGTMVGVTQPVGVANNTLATTQHVMSAVIGASTNIPGQTGNAGKFLSTDGTNASWQFVPAVDFILINAGVI